MKKPIRNKYGTSLLSSFEIQKEIDNTIFLLKFRWLFLGYFFGFILGLYFFPHFKSTFDFALYCIKLGTILGLGLIAFSYIIFKISRHIKVTRLKNEKENAESYERDLKEWRIQTLEAEPLYWKKYKGLEFEQAVFSLFGKMGWDVSRTFVMGDGGINIVGTYGSKIIKIVCPTTSSKVDISNLQKVLGIKLENEIDDIFVVASPVGFDSKAVNLAKKNNIIILDPDELSKLAQGLFNSDKIKLKVL